MHIRAYIGDITEARHRGAIVNAAKRSLEGGGGVDGAIHRAAGPGLLEVCLTLPNLNTVVGDQNVNPVVRCPTGDAVITQAFNINVDFIIHTVGPVYKDDSITAPAALRSCYHRCLEVAEVAGLKTVTFPAIGTGVFEYPLEAAAIVAVNSVLEWMHASVDTEDMKIEFVCFDEHNFLVYNKVIQAAYANWTCKREFV